MHANLVTWRLAPAIQPAEELAAHLRGVWTHYSQLLRQVGLLDVLVVRTGEDEMLAIRLYDDSRADDLANEEAVTTLGTEYLSKVTAIEKRVGRAFDAPQLLADQG